MSERKQRTFSSVFSASSACSAVKPSPIFLGELGVSAVRSSLGSGRLDFGLVGAEDGVDGLDELLQGEGLAEIVLDAEELGIGAVAAALVAGDHDGRDHPAGAALELLQDEEAGLLGHHHVE